MILSKPRTFDYKHQQSHLDDVKSNSQHPESQKRPEFVPLVVKAIIFSTLQNPEQKETA